MIKLKDSLLLVGIALVLSQAPQIGLAQGKGGGSGKGGGGGKGGSGSAGGEARGQGSGKSQGQGKSPEMGQSRGRGKAQGTQKGGRSGQAPEARGVAKGRDNEHAAAAKTNNNRGHKEFSRAASVSAMPVAFRRYAATGRPKDLIAAGAVAHAFARGHGNDFRIDEVGNRMRIANRRGDPLVELDDESAQNLGRWRVGVLDDQVRDGAPSFCRSGAGHPVWGRQWCLDKGFGLGSYNDYRWGRTTDIRDIVFPRSGIGSTLGTSALASLLGPTAFNRLALHAITLGLLEPLTGRWLSQPTGPQMLMVNSGTVPVAELADTNRDYRLEDMLVALLPW